MTEDKKKELIRALKFFLFSCSAGVIQMVLDLFLHDWIKIFPKWASYLTGLVASVIWNFTFNRKFTFKAANNVPKAMAQVFGYYCVFTPISLVLNAYLYDGNILNVWNINTLFSADVLANFDGLISFAATFICMFVNLVTEFLFDKFVVFKGAIDTNDVAQKEKEGA